MPLSPKQLERCQKEKVTIRHSKDPSVPYVVLGFGMMKSGGIWVHSCTYMNVKTKDSFTRAADDFNKFTAPKLK